MALLSVSRAALPILSPSRFLRRCVSASSCWRQGEASRSPGIVLESPFPSITVPDMTLPEYVWRDVDKWHDSPAMVCGLTGDTYTYGELREQSRSFACVLVQFMGLRPGDTLGVHLYNMPQFPAIAFGACEAAVVVTFSNPVYTAEELLRQYQNSQVRCCVTCSALLPVVRQVVSSLRQPVYIIVVDTDEQDVGARLLSYRKLVRDVRLEPLPRASPDSVAVLPYSSGTTGVPKGVMLSHRNLVSNLVMLSNPILSFFHSRTETSWAKVLSIIPLYHIYGFNIVMNASLASNSEIITLPKFIPEDYLNALIKYEPTLLFVVPSMLTFLMSHPAVTPRHLRSVQKIMSGAAHATLSVIDKFRAKADHIEVIQGYGMTEAAPVLLVSHDKFPKSKTGSVGQVSPSTLCRVCDIVTREDLGPHKPGELLFKGPQVMLGYLNNPEATQETVDEDGWLHTGDIAYYDEEGYMYIVDRTKELIKVKGNQVSPTELENLLIQLPEVIDVAVVGVPDEKAGEIPLAFVVLQKNSSMTEKDIIGYLEPRVAPFKRLAGGVKFMDEIPRSPAGKILRGQLKSHV